MVVGRAYAQRGAAVLGCETTIGLPLDRISFFLTRCALTLYIYSSNVRRFVLNPSLEFARHVSPLDKCASDVSIYHDWIQKS